jgi:HEAT repeat protein
VKKLTLFSYLLIAASQSLSLQAQDFDKAVADLKSPDAKVKQRAEQIISAASTAAAPSLIRALNDSDPDYRLRVLRLIQRANDPAAEPAIRKLCESDPQWMIRQEAVNYLVKNGGPDSGPVFERVLKNDSHRFNRAAALRAISYRSRENSVPIIKSYLDDSDAFVRANAARELGRYGDQSGYPVAFALADDKDIQVQSAAVEALGTIGKKSAAAKLRVIATDTKIHQHVHFAAERSLAQLEFNEIPSKAQLDFLKKMLADSSWGRRTWAASELFKRYSKEPQAIKAIIEEAAKDRKHPGNEEARQLAIRVRTGE